MPEEHQEHHARQEHADEAEGQQRQSRLGEHARVPVMLRRLDPQLPVPAYANPGDAGADLVAGHDVTLAPGERALVSTGIAVALPDGYAAFVHPRSGLATRHGVTTLNAPGTIDAGYRGEIRVNLVNTDARTSFTVHRGDRIAQLVVQRVDQAQFIEVDSLPDSARGQSGHGASGGFGPVPPAAPPPTTDAEGRD